MRLQLPDLSTRAGRLIHQTLGTFPFPESVPSEVKVPSRLVPEDRVLCGVQVASSPWALAWRSLWAHAERQSLGRKERHSDRGRYMGLTPGSQKVTEAPACCWWGYRL